jgi:site-specific recombinase XerD
MTDVEQRLSDLPVVVEPSKEFLNPRQLEDYRSEREACLIWLLTFGKDPAKADGYAFETVKTRSYRMDRFYRWVWEQEGGYTANVTPEHADEWMRHLARRDTSGAHKSNSQKAVRMLLKWRHHEHGLAQWDPDISFSDDNSQPRDYLTREEREAIREAALEYGSVPGYSNLTPSERDRWRAHLAQRFEKPKSEVSPDDWDRANGWRIPSLVWVSLDTGLRPIEVKRAVTSWVDIDNAVLRIPKEDSSKNTDNWIVGLRERTAKVLQRWLRQRRTYPAYDGTETLWLTNQDNPFSSRSLRYLLHRLCDIADISVENRQMSWYSIRHSVGTYMTREEDLAAAQAQLRHKSEQTTMKYDQAPVEDRQEALDRMG